MPAKQSALDASHLPQLGNLIMDIKLNFVNRSNDTNNSQIVIFAKNVSTSYDELAIAWLVIQNCGQGDNHPFVYPSSMEVGASDSYGNFTPLLAAENGQLFHMTRSSSGDVLSLVGPGSNPREVQIRNDLTMGAINAAVYKSGRVYAQATSVAPGQMAVFEFRPTIWIGVASEIAEGQVMDSAIMSSVNTEISLLGVTSADIVMTGGGPGESAAPFQFNLENIVMA